jgi:alkaline phosphatase
VLGLFSLRSGDSGDDYGPPLAVSASKALELLSRGDRGFVVMIESETTDERGHDNDITALVEGMRELDEAVRVVLDFARSRGDTLVLVTADHDTGGLGIDDAAYDEGSARIRWATDDHTAQWVPIFAFGPGCAHFGTVIDNTDVARIVGELLELPDFPRVEG